jgi:oligopeptide/dipeptide ABC transporter ATP-binding protein
MTDEAAKALLSVRNLVVEFDTRYGPVRAVDDISFEIFPNETVGIVGESGCGKTVTGLSLLRLVPSPPGRIVQGNIMLNGNDLVQLPEKDMAQLRGDDISMIFQEPMTALNPVLSIGEQMTDVLRQHRTMNKREAREVAIGMLAKVGIPVPEKRIDEYPHELSGGMRQRVMIAMALSCNPKVLVADEPTTALDVTTQAQVLEQIVELQEEFHMAVILITHDLGVIAETCQRAIVMYCGNIVETGTVENLFEKPRHPYTKGLLESIPRLRDERIAELPIIPGMVPDLLSLPAGCRFADRCSYAQADCRQSPPQLKSSGDKRSSVACYHPLD